MKALSEFFYEKARLWHCLALTAIMVLYASLVMGGKSACFQSQLEEGMRVLGLKTGYDYEYVEALFSAMNQAGLQCYRELIVVWDNLFPLLYGSMYVFWLSLLGKSNPLRQRWVGILNLFPLLPAAIDWVENYFERGLVDAYIAGNELTQSAVSTASWVSQIKWLFSSLNYVVLLVMIIWFIKLKLTKSPKA